MNLGGWEKHYVRNGFFWNQHLAGLISKFGDKEMLYRNPKSHTDEIARFKPSDFVRVGRKYGMYSAVAKFLKEDVAPVGDCNRGNIRLLLTENGRLIGFADYLLLRWGNSDLDWRSSLSLLLRGDPPAEVGVIQ